MSRRTAIAKPLVALTMLAVAAVLVGACSSTSRPNGNSAGLTAHDYAAFAGITDPTYTHGDDCVGDLNKDGYNDVLINSHTDQWKLFYGSASGRFTPAPIQIPRGDRHGCAFADFNGDGLLDIYWSFGDCKGSGKCLNAKQLWIQQPNHTFVDEAAKWGITDAGSRGRAPVVVNANGDRRPDLFTGEDVGVKYPSSNKLWINEGNHFVLHNGQPTLEIGANCDAAADLTHNGLDDIGVCSPKNGFHLYRALGNGNYVDATTSFGLATYGKRAVRLADVNNDGWPDLISVTQKRVTVTLNDHGHFGKPVFSLTTKDAMDAALGDTTGDGHLDLYVQMGRKDPGPDKLFLGDGTGHFVPGPPIPMKHGDGESVTVLPHWRNGRDAFIVNNGYEYYTRGDHQLIAIDGTNRAPSNKSPSTSTLPLLPAALVPDLLTASIPPRRRLLRRRRDPERPSGGRGALRPPRTRRMTR